MGVVRFSVCPAQIALLDEAAGVAGKAFTVTLVVPVAEAQPVAVLVSVNEYVPDAAVVALVIDGFCADELNELGPVQL